MFIDPAISGDYNSEQMLDSTIGTQIRELRLARGWSQRELGRRAGLRGAYVAMVEGGERNPKIESLGKFAGALGVPVSQLTGGKEGGGKPGEQEQRLLIEEKESLKLIAQVLDDVITLEQYIEDTPSILRKWAALPPNEIILIADMIAMVHARKRFSKSGRVRREVSPEPPIIIHKKDVVTAVRILGASAMLLPSPTADQPEEQRGA